MRMLHRKVAVVTFLLFCRLYDAYGQDAAIRNTIPVPPGYERLRYPHGSYSDWLQNLELKTRPVILNYPGRVVEPVFYDVEIDAPLGNIDTPAGALPHECSRTGKYLLTDCRDREILPIGNY